MNSQFVRAVFDLDCDWEGLPPVYRIYVNDELFSEREWRWTDCYLQEILQIQAPVGTYTVRIDPVGPQIARFHAQNHRIEHGHALWTTPETIQIWAAT